MHKGTLRFGQKLSSVFDRNLSKVAKLHPRLAKVEELWSSVKVMPHATIVVSGPSTECRAYRAYKAYSVRRPKLLFLQAKSLGVALIAAPEEGKSLLQGKSRQNLRTSAKRAQRGDYRVAGFRQLDRLEDIMAIHHSEVSRQGRTMDSDYLDRAAVTEVAGSTELIPFGVFLHDQLVAYCLVDNLGDTLSISRIIGHSDHLGEGVMYAMMADLLDRFDRREAPFSPSTKWLMYDTWIGASEGLRTFKRNVGFVPYRVTWKWSGPRER